MRTAIDTNILVYAEGVNGLDRRQAALNVLRRLPAAAALLPIQALGELYNVLIRKAGYATADARARLVGWSMSYPTADTTRSALIAASDLAATHRLGQHHDRRRGREWLSVAAVGVIDIAVPRGVRWPFSRRRSLGWKGLRSAGLS